MRIFMKKETFPRLQLLDNFSFFSHENYFFFFFLLESRRQIAKYENVETQQQSRKGRVQATQF